MYIYIYTHMFVSTFTQGTTLSNVPYSTYILSISQGVSK